MPKLNKQTLNTIKDNFDAIKAERCRRSFYYFLQEFWPEVSNDEFLPNWHIELFCKELEIIARNVAEGKRKEYDLVVNVPPGMTKTITFTIMFPVWCWLNWFWMRFITASYSNDLSLESAEYSRDLIRSQKFHQYFPELTVKQDKDRKSNFRVQKIEQVDNSIIIRLGGNRYSTSTGGTLTGFHGHILLVDDPLNPEQAASEVELNKANRWIGQTLSTRKANKATAVTILIMQRLHQNDPSGHILAKNKSVRHISLPGEIFNYKEEVKPPELIKNYKEGLLDSNRLDKGILQDMEADLGQYGYAGQVGQRPTPPGGGMFKVDHFQIIDKMPPEVNIVQRIRYWDKAGTEGGKGARTAGTRMLSLANGKYLITDCKKGRWASEERERIIRETAEADGTSTVVWIEQEPGSGGKESAEGTIKNLAGFSIYKDPVGKAEGNKILRADPYSVQVNNGNILLLRGEWNHEFIEEHRFAPFSTTKDQWDSAAGAFNKLARKKLAGVLGRRENRR